PPAAAAARLPADAPGTACGIRQPPLPDAQGAQFHRLPAGMVWRPGQDARRQVCKIGAVFSITYSVMSAKQDNRRNFVRFSLEQGVLRFGEFKVKSGRLSPYFFNAGLFNTGRSVGQLA